MSTEIIVTVISGACSVLGIIIGFVANSNMVSYRISDLEKKVEKHNNLIERMYKAEESIEILKEQIKVGRHRIDDLEDGK